MRVLYPSGLQEACRCEETALGETLPELAHLWWLSGETLGGGYEVCPYTGVLWGLEWCRGNAFDLPNCLLEHMRLEYRVPKLMERTVSVGQLMVDMNPRHRRFVPKAGDSLPEITFPMQGLLYCWACGHSSWQLVKGTKRYGQKGNLTLGVWLHIPHAVGIGEQSEVWVASPLEEITQQALREGLRLRLAFHKGFFGWLNILHQRKIEGELFHMRFVFDPSVKVI